MDKESCNWFRFAKLLIDIGSEVLRTFFSLEIQTSCFGRYRSIWLEKVQNPTSTKYASILWTQLYSEIDHSTQNILSDILHSWNKKDLTKLTLAQQLHEITRWFTDIQSKINSSPATHRKTMRLIGNKIQNTIIDLTALCDALKQWTRIFIELVNKYQRGLQGKIKKHHDDFVLSCQRSMRKLKYPSKHHLENFVTTSQNDLQGIQDNWTKELQEYFNLWMSEVHSLLESFKNEPHATRYKFVLQSFLIDVITDLPDLHKSCNNDMQQIDRSWNNDLKKMFGTWQLQIKCFAKLGWDFKRLIPLWCMDLRSYHSSRDYQLRDFFCSQSVQSKLEDLKGLEICKDSLLSNLCSTQDFPDIRGFDITLLVFLLRNTCPVCPPDLGWYGQTLKSDLSVGADLMQLRSARNDYIGHIGKVSISEKTFSDLWKTVEGVLCRLSSHCGESFQDKIREHILSLKMCPLEPQLEHSFKGEVITWCKNAILVDISDMSLSGALTEVTVDRLMEMYQSVQTTEQVFFQNNSDIVNLDDQGKASVTDISKLDMLARALIPTRSTQQPGKVLCLQTTATSADLVWEKPKGPDKVSYYEVRYRSLGSLVRWWSVNTNHSTESLTLKDLKSETNYEFKVRAIFCDGDEGPFSEASDTIKTLESLATRLKKTATKLYSANNPRYKLPLVFSNETTNKTAMIRKGRFGERNQLRVTKHIMLVGETGAGKSTLIDGMINYIFGVAWEDDFRFTIIDPTEDEGVMAHEEDKSQTKWITCYEVNYQHGSKVGYNLNIIDTPGFGDILQNMKIVDQIREFFKVSRNLGIDGIDAICFVTQAYLARLTHKQKYIFDDILSLFGKDLSDNIFALITFTDVKEPPVLVTLKEANVPFQQAFNFNNAGLLESTNFSEHADHIFWKLSMINFHNLFSEISHVQQISLQLSSEVLSIRRSIECMIERLQHEIISTNTLKRQIEQHERDIETNREFNYEVEEIRSLKIDLRPGEYVINCVSCNVTCHYPCSCANEQRCCTIGQKGYCNMCPNKCLWSNHKRNNYRCDTVVVKKVITRDDMKDKFIYAIKEKEKKTAMLKQTKLKLNFISSIEAIAELVNKLKQIALKSNPLNEENYVQVLKDTEVRKGKSGLLERVQMLKLIKMKVELVQKILNASMHWNDEEIETFLSTF